MIYRSQPLLALATIAASLGFITPASAEEANREGLIRYGSMREAIGQQQHQGRVRLGDLVKRPHFYGVAALAGLQGEITIYDGQITITQVSDQRQLEPLGGSLADQQATMLVGSYVPAWSSQPVTRDVSAAEFDSFIADTAELAGIKTSDPFVFTVEGEFSDVYLHVINGACPIHARLKRAELAEEERAVETELSQVEGKLVGLFARDAVGQLTHPATTTHVHLLYQDSAGGPWLTGHVERVGLKSGAVVRLAKQD